MAAQQKHIKALNILEHLKEKDKIALKEYYSYLLKEEITSKIYNSVILSVKDKRVKELKLKYDSANNFQKQVKSNDYAYGYYQAMKALIIEEAELYNYDILYITGRKDSKEKLLKSL